MRLKADFLLQIRFDADARPRSALGKGLDMSANVFVNPVGIYVGLNVGREIETVSQAYSLLQDWSPRSRGVAHGQALLACERALAGEGDAEAARERFAAFAERAGILAPDLHGVVAAMAVAGQAMPVPLSAR